MDIKVKHGKEICSWLAECCWNHDIVETSHNLKLIAESTGWQDLAVRSFTLHYEPRCLAISPDGRRIAVGTKAGFIELAEYDDRRGWLLRSVEPECLVRIPQSGLEAEKQSLAIRAAAFLTNDHLVAGWGFGETALIQLPLLSDLPIERPVLQEKAPPQIRFARIISLVIPGEEEHDLPERGELALMLTRRQPLQLLTKDGTSYKTYTLHPRAVSDRFGSNERIIDGTWQGDCLWLVGSHGTLVRLDADGARCLDLKKEPSVCFQLTIGAERVHKIDSCRLGLAIFFGDRIQLWPFEENTFSLSNPNNICSVTVHNSLDMAVCAPFDEECFTLVVSTINPGVRWVRWPKGKSGWGREKNEKRPQPSPHYFAGSGQSSVLQVELAGIRSADNIKRPYIACGTRDERLRIASFLDRRVTKSTLERLVFENQSLLEDDWDRSRGIAFWLINYLIENDFKPRQRLIEKKPDRNLLPALLSKFDAADLRRLSSTVLFHWQAAKVGSPERKERLAGWILLLLQRAIQIDVKLSRELSSSVCRGLRRALLEGALGSEDDGTEAFADFLRKWGAFGYTYGQKEVKILELFRWNHKSDRTLDWVNYLTRLLRQRADPIWIHKPVPGVLDATILDIASGPEGTFTIHSDIDGGILAHNQDGRLLSWEIEGVTNEELEANNITLEYQLRILRQSNHAKFKERYKHGPYARRLLATKVWRDLFVLVFSFKGWMPQDAREIKKQGARSNFSPRIFALLLDASYCENNSISALRILSLDSLALEQEIYALAKLPDESQSGFSFLAGTRDLSFLEFEVTQADDPFEIKLKKKAHCSTRIADRGEFGDRARSESGVDSSSNRCWSMVFDRHHRLWAGFQDGYIRCFDRVAENGRTIWVALRTSGEDSRSSNSMRVETSGAVWCLKLLDEGRLAFGTANGLVGVVDIEADLASSRPIGPVHDLDDAPICSLMSFKSPQLPFGLWLAALSQTGTISLFELENIELEGSATMVAAPGLRLDRFSLKIPARAAVLTGMNTVTVSPFDDTPTSVSRIVVGCEDGSVRSLDLVLPRGSQIRRNVAYGIYEFISQPSSASHLVECVEKPRELEWLRVLHVGGTHLARFSIWFELLRAAREDPIDFDKYLNVLSRISNEVYRRRPLSVEPAKIIWEEGAKVANRQAQEGLESFPKITKMKQCFRKYQTLITKLDDICNSWIGAERSIEATVLMSSFAYMFDWSSILILACPLDIGQAHSATDEIRLFLRKTAERRLADSGEKVPFETLRVINIAIIRAIHQRRQKTFERLRHLNLTWNAKGNRTEGKEMVSGFYQLMLAVSGLAERQVGRLKPSSPLYTELIRFFAASVLLVPSSSLIVGKIVSETGLLEYSPSFAPMMLAKIDELIGTYKLRDDAPSRQARRLLADYFNPIDVWKIAEASRERYLNVDDTDDHSELSNQAFLAEQWRVLRLLAWLAALDPRKEEQSRPPSEDLEWLDGEPEVRFFRESREFLRRLQQERKEIRSIWNEPGIVKGEESSEEGKATGGDSDEKTKKGKEGLDHALDKMRDLCRRQRTFLASSGLPLPQRTHYEGVVASWEDQIENRRSEAIGILEVLDKFNRHVYQRSADSLMSGIAELALQAKPFLYSPRGEDSQYSLRRLIASQLDDTQPVLHHVFTSGLRLVESSHLAGILLTVARDFIGWRSSESIRVTYRIDLNELQEIANREAKKAHLTLNANVNVDDAERVLIPGNAVVWGSIFQELCKNIIKHTLPRARSKRILFYVHREDLYRRSQRHRHHLLCSGEGAFRDTLNDTLFLDCKNDEERSSKLEELARECCLAHDQPGLKVKESGLGLYLIHKICEYLGFEGESRLCHPSDYRDKLSGPVKRRLKWPLTFHFKF